MTAREKGNLCNVHLYVIMQTEKLLQGKSKICQSPMLTLWGCCKKRQRNIGRFKAMQYFMQDVTKRHTWLAPLFNNGKVDLYGSENPKIWCHLVKELGNTNV